MDLQYSHDQLGRKTSVVDVPSKEEFLRLMEQSILYNDVVIDISYGYTNVIKDDQYCKATGRKYALSNIKKSKFILSDVYYYEDGYRNITLKSLTKNIFLVFEIKVERERVYYTTFIN